MENEGASPHRVNVFVGREGANAANKEALIECKYLSKREGSSSQSTRLFGGGHGSTDEDASLACEEQILTSKHIPEHKQLAQGRSWAIKSLAHSHRLASVPPLLNASCLRASCTGSFPSSSKLASSRKHRLLIGLLRPCSMELGLTK
eukprot:1147694-Pelagomonas_calceolata.AAC.5